jgi:transcriptional regulator with XRE-family HTH domain
MSDAKSAISRVAEFRQKAGLTQKQLADLIGTTVITVANWERNRTGIEQIVRIGKLCEALQCSPKDLYKEMDYES